MKRNNLIKRLIVYSLVLILGLTFSFTITKADVSALSKPGKVSFTSLKKDSENPDIFVLKWKKLSKNVKGYKIYRSTKKSSGYKCIKTITKKSTTKYTDESYALNWSGKTYYYKIRAYNKKGSTIKYGKYSKVKSIKLPKIDVKFKVNKSLSDEEEIVIDVSNNTKKKISLDYYFAIYDSYDYYYDYDSDEMGLYYVTEYRDNNGNRCAIEEDSEEIRLESGQSVRYYAVPSYIYYDYDDDDYDYDDDDYDYNDDDYDDDDYDDELLFDYDYCLIDWDFGYYYNSTYDRFHALWEKEHGSRIYCNPWYYDDYDAYEMNRQGKQKHNAFEKNKVEMNKGEMNKEETRPSKESIEEETSNSELTEPTMDEVVIDEKTETFPTE